MLERGNEQGTNKRFLPAGLAAASAATLFFFLPFLYQFWFPKIAETSFFAADAFYYLDVARYSQHVPFFSFDGLYPTNGFHPMWQWIEYLCVKSNVFPVHDNWLTLHRLYLLNLAILSIAVGLISYFASMRLHHRWLVFWISCPGLLCLIFTRNNYFSGWSFLNGMETSVELLFFSLMLLAFSEFLSRPSFGRLALSNFLLGCTVLSRLDDIFFLLPLTVLTLISASPKRFHRLVAASGPYFMVALYLIYNKRTVGTYLPISGQHKAGWVLHDNFHTARVFLMPLYDWKFKFGAGLNWDIYFHLLQMLVPALICATYIALRRGRYRRPGLLEYVAFGVVLKAFYNFSFVATMLQGHWYYGSSIIFTNILLVLITDKILRSSDFARFPKLEPYAFVGSICFAIFTYSFLVRSSWIPEQNSYYRIAMSGPALKQMVQKFGDTRFVELNDGEIAFSSQTPSVSAFGLTGDVQSVRAIESGDFFPLMEKRGVTLIASNYEQSPKDRHYSDSVNLWGGLHHDEFRRYYWKYLGSTQDVFFYRLTPENLQ
jgi:hypothetical protein